MPLALPPRPLPQRAPSPVPAHLVLGSNSTPLSKIEQALLAFSGSGLVVPIAEAEERRDSTQPTPETVEESNSTAKRRRRAPPIPEWLYKCRYGCSDQIFNKVASLRKHMMTVHHVFPPKMRPVTCNCCGRMFATKSDYAKHDDRLKFCEVSPEAKALWNVPPPITQEEQADTWCYKRDGTPSAAVRIPNPEYVPDPVDDDGEGSEPKPKTRGRKRKAGPEIEVLEVSPSSSVHPMLEAAPDRPRSPDSVVELSSGPVKRPRLAQPPTAPSRPTLRRQFRNPTQKISASVESFLDSIAVSAQGLPAAKSPMPTSTPQASLQLQGIGLHDRVPNATANLCLPPIRPTPESFWQRKGNEHIPCQQETMPSLKGTDAEWARLHGGSVLDQGFAAAGRKPKVGRFNFGNAPLNDTLPLAVSESTAKNRALYAAYDAQVKVHVRQLAALRRRPAQPNLVPPSEQMTTSRRYFAQRQIVEQPLPTQHQRSVAYQPYSTSQIAREPHTAQQPYYRPQVAQPQRASQFRHPAQRAALPITHSTANINADLDAIFGIPMTASPPSYDTGYGATPSIQHRYPAARSGQNSTRSSFDSGYASTASLTPAGFCDSFGSNNGCAPTQMAAKHGAMFPFT